MVFQKSRFEWVRFHHLIFMVSRPKFTKLYSPNAGGIAVQNVLPDFEYFNPFQRYSPSNFEVVRNRAKFCFFLAPKIFWGEGPPKILDRHYEIQPTIVHCAKFCVDRSTHLGDFALKQIKNICSKT